MKQYKGKTALVTGASSGIGEDCARLLAGAGCHLILVARREDRLQALKDELGAAHGVRIEVIPADLSRPGAARALFEQTEEMGLQVDLLINNAGFAKSGQFLDVPMATHTEMLQVLITAVTELTHLYAAPMKQRGEGYILQVASIAAYMPTPTLATYGAAKAYVLSLGEALAKELRPAGIQVTTLCPGGTLTEFMSIAGQTVDGMRSKAMMTSQEVASAGLKGMARGRTTVIPGWLYKMSIASTRLFSRNVQARVAEAAIR